MALIEKIYRKLFRTAERPRILNKSKQFAAYEIGDWSYGFLNIVAPGEANLKIGRFCNFASGFTVFLGGEHRPDWVTTYPFISSYFPKAMHFTGHPFSRGDVTIGNDIWIGIDTLVLSGVTIGDGAVIGARSVVRRDIPPYGIFLGDRLVGYRFSKEIINELLKIAWWNWPMSKIEEAWPLMLSTNIEAFVERYKK